MKEFFLYVIFLINCVAYGQEKLPRNIYTIKTVAFNNGLNISHYTNKKGDLLSYTKYYSDEILDEGLINIELDSKLDTIPKKHFYYWKDLATKDSVGNYIYTNSLLTKKIDSNGFKKIKFNFFKKLDTKIDCNDKVYDNVLIIKEFYLSTAFVQKIDNIYKLILLDEDCEIIEEYRFNPKHTMFYEDLNFLILKEKGRFIFVYEIKLPSEQSVPIKN